MIMQRALVCSKSLRLVNISQSYNEDSSDFPHPGLSRQNTPRMPLTPGFAVILYLFHRMVVFPEPSGPSLPKQYQSCYSNVLKLSYVEVMDTVDMIEA